MSLRSLVDDQFLASRITIDDPWCSSHGAENGGTYLGAGILYYALAYALAPRLCVCLGSGGGFVPRLMRQAQRDLKLEPSRTILVDGAQQVSDARKDIWGSPCWVKEDSTFRTNYPDVEILLQLTAAAYDAYFLPQGLVIDYLHIDADHHYDGVKRDWELYRKLVPDEGVITLHDTVNYREPCGVPRLLDEIRASSEYDVVNFPIAYGTAIVRKRLPKEAKRYRPNAIR
jgi:Methyltransferase domain